MADPEQIGTSDAHLYDAGPAEMFDAHQPTLTPLGGGTRFFGADPGLASLYLAGATALGYELLIGHLHTVALMAHRMAGGHGEEGFSGLIEEVRHGVADGSRRVGTSAARP